MLTSDEIAQIRGKIKEDGEKSLADETKEYTEWEKTALEGLAKLGTDSAAFIAKYRTAFRAERNELIGKGYTSKEAGEKAFTAVKLNVLESKDGTEKTPEVAPGMPAASTSTTPQNQGVIPVTQRETVMSWPEEKQIAYIKQHRVMQGNMKVTQFAN